MTAGRGRGTDGSREDRAEAERAISEPPDTLRALYEAKASAELAAADRLAPGSDLVAATGNAFAQSALVKGLPGPAEIAGGQALAGADGVAADRVLEALGYDPTRSFRLLSRPAQGFSAEQREGRLRLALEAVDPDVVIALDAEAAEDVSHALGVDGLQFGRPILVRGRTCLAVDGLEASLVDERRKRRVWRQFKSLKQLASEERR